eukprot:TRINITY_DN1493_c0_g1_i1.p1 TRINITY_DN1493_c0_g1~~TRINITY_DN1493_c0_g1_i1.p1  ORF type:complete len:406 (+),score=196.85 TRINITY_DN1493_c0_g1_i1:320-1537(+)
MKKNVEHIPFFGTWKDLLSLMNTPMEEDVVNIYAEQLKKDKEVAVNAMEIKDNKKPTISLAVKWAPTEKHEIDKKTQAATKIANKLSEGSKHSLKDYRKEYLVPLRKYLAVTEVYMCANDWENIPYGRVPSRCMNLNRKAFEKHDPSGFGSFMADVQAGKVEIKGKQMFPHELAAHFMKSSNTPDAVIEEQWKVIIKDVVAMGKLTDSIVLSDVSGSMSGTPMEVAIGLGLLISEVTAPPFQNAVITFHESPTFHVVKGNSFRERVKNLQGAPWGGTTNFQAVFDLILKRAKDNNLPVEAMPKRLFVISDMQFDAADGQGKYKTNHANIKAKFTQAGYKMPTMIYWNVRANTPDFPVTSNESGVVLVSGYSPSVMKDIVEAGEFDNPEQVVRRIIENPRYNVLQV